MGTERLTVIALDRYGVEVTGFTTTRVVLSRSLPISRRTPLTPLIGPVLAALLVLSVATESLAAQATLRGRVVDSETGAPVVGAHVTIRRGTPIDTDSLGRFESADLKVGDADLTIQLLGYAPGTFKVRINDAGVVDKVFSLDFTGQRLAAVAVQARAEQIMSRYADFETRRQRGLGAFLRWDQLTDEKYGSVGDALRGIRGVRIRCNQQSYECFAAMVRSPQCKPVWIIDGMEAGSFNENTPIRDVYGIEVYRGPGEIPGEYSGSNAACGVIVMWTKSRPYRSTTP
jgi:hypothetical protein